VKITVSTVDSDVIVTLEDASGEQDFSGYRLERQKEEEGWLVWNGTAWAPSGAVLLTEEKFADYEVSTGLYQYRYRIEYSVGEPSEYEYSDWVNIGIGRVGWTFENYRPPENMFGEVLTADDLRYTYLWGLDFRSTNGQEYTDEQIRTKVVSSISEIERALKITINKKRILTQPDTGLVRGVDYDIEEDPYPFRPDKWHQMGMINLRRRPVISLERIEFFSVVDSKILDLSSWIRLDKTKGRVNISFPKTGDSGVFPGLAYGIMMAQRYAVNYHYPHGFKIDYTAGYPDASCVDADLRDIIGKIAACKLLNIIGDGLIAGFSSSSLSMDGFSESFSSTQSATNAYFGARIGVYLKDIENYLKENRRKFRNFTIGNI
jgi:hypothetical protein